MAVPTFTPMLPVKPWYTASESRVSRMTEPAEGYADSLALYYWEEGVLFSVSGCARDGFNAQKWRSGLGAYFFQDCTAVQADDGTWTYAVGSEAIS